MGRGWQEAPTIRIPRPHRMAVPGCSGECDDCADRDPIDHAVVLEPLAGSRARHQFPPPAQSHRAMCRKGTRR